MLRRVAAPICSVLFMLSAACGTNNAAGPDAARNDAPSGPVCGDGICAPSETATCPADCGTPIDAAIDAPHNGDAGIDAYLGTCNNNGTCEPELGESNTSCPSDCTYVCGNGICETGEDVSSCPVDCGPPPFDCTGSANQMACNTCLVDDLLDGPGYCDANHVMSSGTANDCAACIGSGVFDVSCGSACSSGVESTGCAECVAEAFSCGNGTCEEALGETIDTCPADCTWDCSLPGIQTACVTCLDDDYSEFVGDCDDDNVAYPGDAEMCAACVGSGFTTAGSVCAAYCGEGESSDCIQCVAAQEFCGDGACESYDGETHAFCPTDCNAVCGDGACQTSQGETIENCPEDCTPQCDAANTEVQCEECFFEDATEFLGYCEDFVTAPISGAVCAGCVASGGFGSDNPCESACSSGETSACAHCMNSTGAAIFDCANPYTVVACQQCFADEEDSGPGTCDSLFDAYPGSAADCLSCALDGTFGSGCATLCGSGESSDCFTCVSIAQDCGDGFCDTGEGESPIECPVDCSAVCGDGTCDTAEGENPTTCPADCPPAAGDTCSIAIPLTLDTATAGTSVGAYSDYGASTVACTTYPETGPDVVYSVTLTAGTAYTATVSTSDSSFDMALSLLGPGDASICTSSESACVIGADEGTEGDTETFTYTPATTGNYFVIVDEYGGGTGGPFTLTVSD